MELLNRLSSIDQRLFLWLAHSTRGHFQHNFAKLISKTGDGYLQVTIPAIFWIVGGADANRFFIMIAAAFVVERSLYWVLKNSLKRRRPPEAIPAFNATISASDEFSFPSGHTSGAFLLAVMCSTFAPGLGAPLFIWASAVGCARVILGVHFPADILAGIMLGGSIGWIFSSLI